MPANFDCLPPAAHVAELVVQPVAGQGVCDTVTHVDHTGKALCYRVEVSSKKSLGVVDHGSHMTLAGAVGLAAARRRAGFIATVKRA